MHAIGTNAVVTHEAQVAGSDQRVADPALDTETRVASEFVDGYQVNPASPRLRRAWLLPGGCSLPCWRDATALQECVAIGGVCIGHVQINDRRVPHSQRACFVENNGIDRVRLLQRLDIHDQYAARAAAPVRS